MSTECSFPHCSPHLTAEAVFTHKYPTQLERPKAKFICTLDLCSHQSKHLHSASILEKLHSYLDQSRLGLINLYLSWVPENFHLPLCLPCFFRVIRTGETGRDREGRVCWWWTPYYRLCTLGRMSLVITHQQPNTADWKFWGGRQEMEKRESRFKEQGSMEPGARKTNQSQSFK